MGRHWIKEAFVTVAAQHDKRDFCRAPTQASEGDFHERSSRYCASETPALHCSVDVLGTAEPVTDVTALDVKRYGVIVSKGFRRGLLLPDLEGVETPKEQIAIALRNRL
jgi:AMMECR1 domain-containing protein